MSDATYASFERGEPEFQDYFALLKPRVMSLVVFTAAVGLFVAPVGVHPIIAFASLLLIAIGAGASGSLNMWWDADIDAVMRRTASRPVPTGRVSSDVALQLGLWLSVFSVGLLALFANWVAAGLLAFTIFFYAVIYTMWLKRWTPQTIVIGGAAGAFPPMIGWAVATGGVSVESVLMFALIFMWTPPHFWALSLYMNDDYSRAGVPMMTVARGKPHTRRLILGYTLVLVPVSLAVAFTSIGGALYLAVALALNLWFLGLAARVSRRQEAAAEADRYATERQLFKVSLIYLFFHFVAILAEGVLRATDLAIALPVWF